MEVQVGDDPYEDPFVKEGLQKKLKKEQQKMSELKNRLEAKGYNARDVLNQTEGRKEKKKKMKQQVTKALSVAQNSTGSMGLFDEKAHKGEKKIKVKKRKHIPEFKNSANEKNRDLEILDMVNKNQGSKKLKKE